ncbi:MAG: hypothetical protein J6N78_01490 [Clostridia bacterium]|nr:hypothetical protein [Clostridia bacterium]
MNKKIILCATALIVIILLVVIMVLINDNHKEENSVFINEYEEIDKNQISYNKNSTVNELKEESGLKGNSDIYDIREEYDGRKILTVKTSLKFKVAFCGLIEKEIPQIDELDNVFKDKLPHKYGVWIENKSRDKIIKAINDSGKTNSKYAISAEGYLYIVEKNEQTQLDKKIEKAINGNKLNILTKSSVCYIVDDVTGEFLDYNFEKMDKYQTYEYFEDDDKKIIFITENNGKQLNDEDILEDVVNLIEKGL